MPSISLASEFKGAKRKEQTTGICSGLSAKELGSIGAHDEWKVDVLQCSRMISKDNYWTITLGDIARIIPIAIDQSRLLGNDGDTANIEVVFPLDLFAWRDGVEEILGFGGEPAVTPYCEASMTSSKPQTILAHWRGSSRCWRWPCRCPRRLRREWRQCAFVRGVVGVGFALLDRFHTYAFVAAPVICPVIRQKPHRL